MAILNATRRGQIATAIQRWWSVLKESCAFIKPELAAAIAAADQWADDNAASYNSALPVSFRTKATPLRKTVVLVYVIIDRARRDGANLPLPYGD